MPNKTPTKRGRGGGKPLNLEKTFPGDIAAQDLWKNTYDPLQREMKQLFRDGVDLPKDLSIPQISGAKPWSGMREGDTGRGNDQHWTLYYQYWCIENSIHKLSDLQTTNDLPYVIGFGSVDEKLNSLRIARGLHNSASAKMRAVIYERIKTRTGIIKSKEFRDLMLSNYHIGHYIWIFLYKDLAEPKESTSAAIIDKSSSITELSDLHNDLKKIDSTEASRIVKQRLGQALFRKLLIKHWGGTCAVSGLRCQDLLRASHAKPWVDCASDEERLDVFNGFLLSAQFDALFDSGLMTFKDSGAAKFSPKLSEEDRKLLKLDGSLNLRSRLDSKHLPFLAWHRENVFISTV